MAEDLLLGRSLGEFVLRERIGEGGFGAVYRAVQPALEREAVIKVLHSRLHQSKAASERFLREAKLASKLDHPYAAHVYAFGAEPDGELWIAMELVRGTPLDKLLKLQGPISIERFVPLLDRICEVVHSAHEAGIVHRDLKPANVMVLSRAGRLLPKLLDFGIAKAGVAAESSPDLEESNTLDLGQADPTAKTMDTPPLGNPPPFALTVRGAIMGSPPYMAPEQWLDAGTVDARTDLYALGILAYECLIGRPPFLGTSLTQIAQAHALDKPPRLGAGFPPAIDVVLDKVLAKRSSDRYPDALAFAVAFRAASGIAAQDVALPVIERASLAIAGAPQPIAEAIAGYEASRNPFRARDALAMIGRTIARYLGVLALACRARIASDDDGLETLRELYRRPLTDKEWIDLARELTRGWIDRRDAYPIPELIGAFHDDAAGELLAQLVGLRQAEIATDEAALALLEGAVGHASLLLDALAFLAEYPLVVTTGDGLAERWMGARRAARTTVSIRGKPQSDGTAVLLDRDAAPVLSLAPIVQVAEPSPGAPLELFLFDGRDRVGARLVALPASFAHHDDRVWDWFRAQLADSLDTGEERVAQERAPYRGLSPFTADDTALFVGREQRVDAFVNRLRLQPLLAVVGRSGAGKSSFVHAGVAPALAWRTIALRPGPAPLASLAARLEHGGIAGDGTLGARLRADATVRGPILVVVDQLEELFTLCSDEVERAAFAESLASAARAVDDPVRVVLTLRDDFLVRAEQVPALRNRLGQGLQLLTVPAPDELLRILVEPARRVGYELEGDLAKTMVDEVAEQPGALALISFTASKLWELRDRHFKQLTRSAYKTLGGVGGALGRHAELTLDAMPPEERALTREAFRSLVTSQNTRAVLGRGELRQLLGNGAHADGVIEKLLAARLLVTSENESGAEVIEIIHEALIVTWPRLVEWHREDIEGTRFREQLRTAARQWDERARPKGLLWRGDALGEVARWRGRQTSPLTDVEAAFTDGSLADAARVRRNIRIVVAAIFAVLAVGIVVLLVLNTQVSGQRATLALQLQRESEDRGRQYLLEGDPQRALAYLGKARTLGASGRDHDFLVAQAIQATDGEVTEVRQDNSLTTAQFTPDGGQLLTAGYDHKAVLWNASTGDEVRSFQLSAVVRGAATDGKLVIALGGTELVGWDAHTGAERFRRSTAAEIRCVAASARLVVAVDAVGGVTAWTLPEATSQVETRLRAAGVVHACALSPDGELLAAGDIDGGVRVWRISSGALLHDLDVHVKSITAVAFSPSGDRVFASSEDGTTTAWTLDGALAFTLSMHANVRTLDVSPDGAFVATGSDDKTAVIWDAHTGARLRTLEGHTAGLWRVRFAPDSKTLVTAAEENTAHLWEVATGQLLARWHGHDQRINDIAFDPTSHRVVTAGEDGAAIVWSVAPQSHSVWLRGHTGDVYDVRLSPDGSRAVTASLDGTARVWDATAGTLLETFAAGAGTTTAVFSPDGTRIATSASSGDVVVWDVQSGAALLRMRTASDGALDWSGDWIVSSSQSWLRCWNARTGALRFEREAHHKLQLYSASFDSSGTKILTTGDDLAIHVWDLDGNELRTYDDKDIAISADLDPSGTRILTAESRAPTRIRDAATGALELELDDNTGRVVDAKWSHDGALALTLSRDDTVRIWNAVDGTELAVIAAEHPNSASFSRDGSRVAIAAGTSARIVTLPFQPPAELDQILACRTRFTVLDRLASRRRPRCVGDRRR